LSNISISSDAIIIADAIATDAGFERSWEKLINFPFVIWNFELLVFSIEYTSILPIFGPYTFLNSIFLNVIYKI